MSRLQAILPAEWKELLQKTCIQKANTIAIYCGRMEQGFFSSSLTSDWSQSTHSCPRVEESATRQPAWILETAPFLSKKTTLAEAFGPFGGKENFPEQINMLKNPKPSKFCPPFSWGHHLETLLRLLGVASEEEDAVAAHHGLASGLFGGFGSHSWQWSWLSLRPAFATQSVCEKVLLV